MRYLSVTSISSLIKGISFPTYKPSILGQEPYNSIVTHIVHSQMPSHVLDKG